MLLLPVAQIQSLFGEVTSQKLHSAAKKKKKITLNFKMWKSSFRREPPASYSSKVEAELCHLILVKALPCPSLYGQTEPCNTSQPQSHTGFTQGALEYIDVWIQLQRFLFNWSVLCPGRQYFFKLPSR